MAARKKRLNLLMYALIVGAVMSAMVVGLCWEQRDSAVNRMDTVLRRGDDSALPEGQTYNQFYEEQTRIVNSRVAVGLIFGCITILNASVAIGLYLKSGQSSQRRDVQITKA